MNLPLDLPVLDPDDDNSRSCHTWVEAKITRVINRDWFEVNMEDDAPREADQIIDDFVEQKVPPGRKANYVEGD